MSGMRVESMASGVLIIIGVVLITIANLMSTGEVDPYVAVSQGLLASGIAVFVLGFIMLAQSGITNK